MDEDDICYLTAGEALRRFRAGSLSPLDLIESLVSRDRALGERVNAFTSRHFGAALAAAAEAERRYAVGTARPLEGIPVAVKGDAESAVAGTISCDGTLWRKGCVDTRTCPSVERLISAGAIVLARTTLPELAWAWTCHTRAWGLTANPWNPRYSAGGSSSGSAAAVAAGLTTLATGTDCLGSLRHPAAMCGVVGYKPPFGRNPLAEEVSFDTFSHFGAMARSVEDCALAQNVMSGPHPLDHNSMPDKIELSWPPESVSGLRVAFTFDFGMFPVAADVREATIRVVEALAADGAEVSPVETDWAAEVFGACGRYVDLLRAPDFMDAVAGHFDELCDYTIYFERCVRLIEPDQFARTVELAGRLWRSRLGPMFERFDAFLCPTVGFHHVPAANRPWEQSIEVNGRQHTDNDGVMTGAFNLFSRCPAMTLPSGLTREGLPTAVQVVGRPYDDAMVFRVAAAIERAHPFYRGTDRRPALPADIRLRATNAEEARPSAASTCYPTPAGKAARGEWHHG